MKTKIVGYSDIISTMRFDGSYHNAEVNVYDKVINSHSEHQLSYYCSEIFTSGRSKRTYTAKENGVPFLSNSDVVSANPFMVCKYISKKHGFDEKAVLKEGMILTGRVGAIGQTAFVPSFIEKANAMGSDNIIRIVVKPEFKNGFLYAYLASKIGNLSFWKHATGGVQPFITDVMVGDLPIPKLSDAFQQEVDNLIQDSSRLREESAKALDEAKSKIINYCNTPYIRKKDVTPIFVKSSNILHSLNVRFDAPVFINDALHWLNSLKCETKRLGECKIKTWYPGMFKRSYVVNGYPYIKGSDLFLADPFRKCEHLSHTRTPKLEELWLKENQILITCAGACGLVKLITKEYEEKNSIGSPDIIRLVSEDPLFTKEYLFAYLQVPAIYDYMQSLKYGSVIERFDISNIETIPIVKPTEELSKEVTEIIKYYADCNYRAFKAEEKAISMVEQEIEKWNN